MKRMYGLAALAILLCLGACSPDAPPPSASESSPSSPEQPVAEEQSDEEVSAEEELPVPMDAAMYRGELTSVTEEEGSVAVRLEQAPGTNFGSPDLTAVLSGDTLTNFDLADLTEGNYLEVYYGSLGGVSEEAAVIAAKLLPDAELCLFNGTLTEIQTGEISGSMRLTSLDNKGDIIFNFDENTQFYLDFDSLQAGDELNIYFSGASTRSIPPQATALEVRAYAGSETHN